MRYAVAPHILHFDTRCYHGKYYTALPLSVIVTLNGDITAIFNGGLLAHAAVLVTKATLEAVSNYLHRRDVVPSSRSFQVMYGSGKKLRAERTRTGTFARHTFGPPHGH